MNTSVLLFLNIGGQETIFILIAVLLLFGGKKLPELARGLGKGIREFKDATDDVKNEIHKNINAVQDDLNKEIESVKKDTDVDLTPPVNNYTEGSAYNNEVAGNNTEGTGTKKLDSPVTTDETHLNSN